MEEDPDERAGRESEEEERDHESEEEMEEDPDERAGRESEEEERDHESEEEMEEDPDERAGRESEEEEHDHESEEEMEEDEQEDESDGSQLSFESDGSQEEDEPDQMPGVSSRFMPRSLVPGTMLSHIEVSLRYVRLEIQTENVKIVSLNYTRIAQAIQSAKPRAFPRRDDHDISRYIQNIVKKAKKDFERNKSILPKILRAGNDRETRMHNTMSSILRLDSTAPAAARRNRNRGVARRPAVVSRPVLPGPGVGRIAPDVRRIDPDVRRIAPDVRRIAPDVQRIDPDVRR